MKKEYIYLLCLGLFIGFWVGVWVHNAMPYLFTPTEVERRDIFDTIKVSLVRCKECSFVPLPPNTYRQRVACKNCRKRDFQVFILKGVSIKDGLSKWLCPYCHSNDLIRVGRYTWQTGYLDDMKYRRKRY